jgi:hypothetical protein
LCAGLNLLGSFSDRLLDDLLRHLKHLISDRLDFLVVRHDLLPRLIDPILRGDKQLVKECLALYHQSLGEIFGSLLNHRKDARQAWSFSVLVSLEF